MKFLFHICEVNAGAQITQVSHLKFCNGYSSVTVDWKEVQVFVIYEKLFSAFSQVDSKLTIIWAIKKRGKIKYSRKVLLTFEILHGFQLLNDENYNVLRKVERSWRKIIYPVKDFPSLEIFYLYQLL